VRAVRTRFFGAVYGRVPGVSLHAFTGIMSRSLDNFLYFEKKGFGIGGIWQDVSDISLAGQRAMA